MNSYQIGVYVARRVKPTLFREPDRPALHIALTAFPHVSQTLCGLQLTDLERTNHGNGPLCKTCTLKLGALAARLIK
jgi:hypothetical protein